MDASAGGINLADFRYLKCVEMFMSRCIVFEVYFKRFCILILGSIGEAKRMEKEGQKRPMIVLISLENCSSFISFLIRTRLNRVRLSQIFAKMYALKYSEILFYK